MEQHLYEEYIIYLLCFFFCEILLNFTKNVDLKEGTRSTNLDYNSYIDRYALLVPFR